MWFELLTAFQVAVLTGFEIAESQGYRTRSHSLADLTYTFRQLVYHFFRMTGFNQIQRMFMDVGCPNKLFTHQTDTVARQGCIFFCQFRITQVHINLGAGRREEFRCYCCARSNRCCCRRFCIFQDTFIYNPVGRVNSNISTIRNRSRCCSAAALATNNTGNAQLAADNGSVAGHTAAVRYDSFGFFHGRNPVRRRHFRN